MGWLMTCLLVVLLWRTRRQLKALLRATPSATEVASAPPALASYQNVPLAYQHLHNLVVLCLELSRLRTAGTLEPVQYADLTAQLDTLWTNIVRHLGAAPQSRAWHEARTAAWELLVDQYMLREPPPWAEETAPATPAETLDAETPPAHLHEAIRAIRHREIIRGFYK
jgi:FAD/FMN-containing dehydrogenase